MKLYYFQYENEAFDNKYDPNTLHYYLWLQYFKYKYTGCGVQVLAAYFPLTPTLELI